MDSYKQIKDLLRENKYQFTRHSLERCVKYKLTLVDAGNCLKKCIIFPADCLETDDSEENKFFCISKFFLDYITFVILLYPQFVLVKTLWPSKKHEMYLYKEKQKEFRRKENENR